MAKKNIGDAIKKEVKSVAKKAENVNSLIVDVRDIQISKIKANENNFFSVEEDEKFASLVESIKENGVVEPVIVVDDGDGTYTMISGHRRMKASQVVGNKTIPARIKHSLDEKDKMIYLIDTNMTVRDLSVADIINAIKQYEALIKEFDIKIEGRKTAWIGKRIGMSDRQVSKYMSLEKIDDRIKALFDERIIGLKQASDLAVLDPEKQEKAYIELKGIIAKAEEEKPGEEIKIVDKIIQEIKDELTGKKEEVTETVKPEQKAEGETATVEEKPVTDFTDLGNGEKVEGKEPDFSELNNGEENLPFTGNETTPEKEDETIIDTPAVKIASLSNIKKNVTELIRLCKMEMFENDFETKLELEKCMGVIENTITALEKKQSSAETE